MGDTDRSFPEAGDGRPTLPMQAELWAAGCDLETARFVARQLRRDGYYLVRPDDLGWDDIRRFQAEIRKGQDVFEDGGGFFVRALSALLRIHKPGPVRTYQDAAREMLEARARDEGDGT